MQKTWPLDGKLLSLKTKSDTFKCKKTIYATWDGIKWSDSEEDSDIEEAMIWFMAFDEN